MRVIGNNHKPGPGESLLWLIAQVSEKNFFCRAEVIKVFAKEIKLAFSNDHKSNPGTLEGFDLHAVKSFLSISESNLGYSLLDFYFPEHRYGVLATYIRICPICAAQGTHLLIHQVQFWKKCPLHNRKLINICQVCGEGLERFSVKFQKGKGAIFNPFRCKNCGNNVINPGLTLSKPQIRKLEKFLVEYSDWIMKINNAFQKEVFLFDTDKKPSVGVIQSTNLISGSPSWVRRCFVKSKNFEEIEHVLENTKLNLISAHSKPHDLKSNDVLVNQYAKQLLLSAENFKSYLKEIFEITNDTMTSTIEKKTHIPTIKKTHGYSIWCEALIYLENYINYFQKHLDQYIYWCKKGDCKWRPTPYFIPNFFDNFMAGLFRMLSIDSRLMNNKTLSYKLLKLWVNEHLYSLYCMYLGKIITQDLSHFWLYSNNTLDDYMMGLEDNNTYFYYYYRDSMRFRISSKSRIDSYELKKIFKSGFITAYGFERSLKIRRSIQKIIPHVDLSNEEYVLISRSLKARKKQ